MHVYGPVPSRRLGRSVGVDLLPAKTCNYACVYCQLGRTQQFTNTRASFFKKEKVWEELTRRISQIGRDSFDFITFVGNGEPTLSKDLGWLVRQIQQKYSTKKTALITNGALLYDPIIQKEITPFDVVLPSLDAGMAKTFKIINRPHSSLTYKKVLKGLFDFRKNYPGELWLEVMLVQGINDSNTELAKIANQIQKLQPEKVYINVPIRPPCEGWVKIPDLSQIQYLKSLLAASFDITLPEEGLFRFISQDYVSIKQELVETIKRHPMRRDQVDSMLESKEIEPARLVAELLGENQIRSKIYNDVEFFEWAEYKYK